MTKVSDSAYKAAVAIIERVNEDSDLDLCVVAQGGHCRDFKGCIDHAASVIAAIIDSHMESGDEMTTWNRCTPDHIPDARKMIDPLISIVTWARYDGSPETLPGEERQICLSRYNDRVVVLFRGRWYDGIDFSLGRPKLGDMWAYMPEPPEAEE